MTDELVDREFLLAMGFTTDDDLLTPDAEEGCQLSYSGCGMPTTPMFNPLTKHQLLLLLEAFGLR